MTTERVRVVGVLRAEIDVDQLAHALLRHLIDQLDENSDGATDRERRDMAEAAS